MNPITGTTRADRLNGTSGNDSIDGLAGADFINAGAGDDTIVYDQNDKRIAGEAGTDTLLLNGTGQRINLNNKAILGIEVLRLEGGGGHTVTLRAADVVRLSDTDSLTITGTPGGLVNTRLQIGTGWTFIGSDGESQTLTNGQATLIVQLPVVIEGYSNNATINFAPGADTAVTEDEGSGPATRPLQATGQLLVDDINAGQGMLVGTPTPVGTPLGTLTLTLVSPDTATAAGVYDYVYSVDNDTVQSLRAGQSVVDSFIVRTVDGSTKTLSFTINGADDAAVIGDPTANSVTEDQNVVNGNLTAIGTISISGSGQASFQTAVVPAADSLGSLELQANGSYTYQVSNASVQSLGAGATKVDTFTVTATDGTSKAISFTINGVNDAAVIGLPTVSDVTEDQNGNGDYLLKAEGSIGITDDDNGQASFKTAVVSASGNLGSLTLQANGSYTYQVSNASVQSLAGGPPKVDNFTVESVDGTAKTISFAINGVNDPAVIGLPTVSSVTEDQDGNGDYLLKAEGSISITDDDNGQASFKTAVVSASGNLGSLTLQANGSYTYQVSNASVQSLGAGAEKVDTFTVTATDGTSQSISFTINGVNDPATIGNPDNFYLKEDQNVVDGFLIAEGHITVTDPDDSAPKLKPMVDVQGTWGTLSLSADGSYVYKVDNAAVQRLGGTEMQNASDPFLISTEDGATRWINFVIEGTPDDAFITYDIQSISEDANGSEVDQLTVTGQFTVTDPDEGGSTIVPFNNMSGKYGFLSVAMDGHYTYTALNPNLQPLGSPAWPSDVDTFTVSMSDGSSQDVQFILNGVNDAPVILPFDQTVTADVFELASGDPNANSLTVKTVSGSFLVFDADGSDTLTSVTGSQSIEGTYGTLSFTFYKPFPTSPTSRVDWTYSYTDRALNPLLANANVTESFNIFLEDGNSATVSQTVDIHLYGAGESFNTAPEIYQISEIPFTGSDGENTEISTVNGFINALGIAKILGVYSLNSNEPFFNNFDANLDKSSATIDWQFEVNQRYLAYLNPADDTPDNSLRQSFEIVAEYDNGQRVSKIISVDLVGTFRNYQQWTLSDQDDIFSWPFSWDILRGLDGNDNLEFRFPASHGKLYGENGDDTLVANGNYVLAVGGNGNDTFNIRGSYAEVYGGVGNDTFHLNDSAAQDYWGGPGSDTYVLNVTSSAIKIYDFDITPVSLGGDVVKISADILAQVNSPITVRPSDSGNSWVLDIDGSIALEFIGSNFIASDFIGHYGP